MATTRYTHPAVRKAASVLRRLSDDEETRLQAQARELALINRVSELSAARPEGLEQGLEQGRKQGELIGQIRLLQEIRGLPVETDAALRARSVAELQDLLQTLKPPARG